jgi:hypothetical protein
LRINKSFRLRIEVKIQEFTDCHSIHLQMYATKRLFFIPVVGSQYRYGATTEAAESLVAQIKSQSKLATARRDAKIEKVDANTKFNKQKNIMCKGYIY